MFFELEFPLKNLHDASQILIPSSEWVYLPSKSTTHSFKTFQVDQWPPSCEQCEGWSTGAAGELKLRMGLRSTSAIILNLPPNPKSQALWRKFLGLDTRQYTQIVCVNDFRARGLGPVEGQTGRFVDVPSRF
jgi:hypothetical protein